MDLDIHERVPGTVCVSPRIQNTALEKATPNTRQQRMANSTKHPRAAGAAAARETTPSNARVWTKELRGGPTAVGAKPPAPPAAHGAPEPVGTASHAPGAGLPVSRALAATEQVFESVRCRLRGDLDGTAQLAKASLDAAKKARMGIAQALAALEDLELHLDVDLDQELEAETGSGSGPGGEETPAPDTEHEVEQTAGALKI